MGEPWGERGGCGQGAAAGDREPKVGRGPNRERPEGWGAVCARAAGGVGSGGTRFAVPAQGGVHEGS